MYKFESLEVWELSLEYVDMIYRTAAQLPETERYNLNSQVIRAGTSIALNIAEGSTGKATGNRDASLEWPFAHC
jgi:four helix bundle protein